jgi:cytochrome c5
VSADHDKVFFMTFTGVIGVLVAIAVVIAIAAHILTSGGTPSKEQVARIEDRIKPVGQVNTDVNATLPPPPPAGAAPMSGQEVVAKVCSGCHGVLPQAPKPGDKAAWSARASAAGGLKGLVASASKGKGVMPPRGGNPNLSDAELEAAIKVMSGL